MLINNYIWTNIQTIIITLVVMTIKYFRSEQILEMKWKKVPKMTRTLKLKTDVISECHQAVYTHL